MEAFRTPPGKLERALREAALDWMDIVDACAVKDAPGGASDTALDTALDIDFMGACDARLEAGTCGKGEEGSMRLGRGNGERGYSMRRALCLQ